MTDKRRRVQLDFSPQAFKRLQAVKEQVEARTNAEVVRNALRLYEWFLTQRDESAEVMVKRKDGEVVQVELIL